MNTDESCLDMEQLRARLDTAVEDTEKMVALSQQRLDEMKRNQDILFALDFVDFARKLIAFDDCTYYDYIYQKMCEYKHQRIAAIPCHIIQKKKEDSFK